MGRSGSRFDPEKSHWFNHQHIQRLGDDQLLEAFQQVVKANGIEVGNEKLGTIIPIIKPRINFIHQVWDESRFFFIAPETYDPGVIKKRWKEDTPEKMRLLAEALDHCEPFTAESVESCVKGMIANFEWGMGAIMNTWRLLLVGGAKGPGLFDLAAFLGKKEVIARMHSGSEKISG